MDRSKQNLFNVLSLVGIMFVAVAAIGISAIVNWKDSLAPARTITVSAQGMTVATPDEAVIDFSVVTQGANPQTLSDNNNTQMTSVLQFVASQGIASSDIATTGYDLQPNYSYPIVPEPDANGGTITRPPTISGYTLTQTVEVKVRDLTKVASVLGGLAPLGVNQIGNVSYTFQNQDKFVALARADALTNAANEAAQMAAQSGASLGEVVTVAESSNVPGPVSFYGMSAQAGGVAMPSAATPSLQPGTQDVTDMVTVTYALN